MLYDGVQKLIRAHLESTVAPAVAGAPAEHVLAMLRDQWTQHVSKTKMISDLLTHLVSGGGAPPDPGQSFRSRRCHPLAYLAGHAPRWVHPHVQG